MKIDDLFPGFIGRRRRNCDISGLCYDSRRVKPGYAFFAIQGTEDDGHKYVSDALERGASALVVERELSVDAEVAQIVVGDARTALAVAAKRFYGDPSRELKVSAVTGTNGKTSTVYLTRWILQTAGHPTGMLSTVAVDTGKRVLNSTHTTPESLEIQDYLSEMSTAGLSHAVMEASSHALDQGRLCGLNISSAVFTNLTPDHLDYHGDMESYLDCKGRLFEMLNSSAFAVLNRADSASTALAQRTIARCMWYGNTARVDVSGKVLSRGQDGTRLLLTTPEGSREVFTRLVGEHNVENILAATANAICNGISIDAIATGIESFCGTPGRLQKVDSGQNFTVLIDYAHTHDALEKVLQSLQSIRGTGRILLVFGCGGDRDASKRPLMGRAAEQYSDAFWVTSDNPRSEAPGRIIDDILEGVTRTEPGVEPDRRAAIHAAISEASEDDIVLIAGKGHEDYQIIGKERRHFDDAEEAVDALNDRMSRSCMAVVLPSVAEVSP